MENAGRKDNIFKKGIRALGRYTFIVMRWIICRLPYPAYKSLMKVLMFAGKPLLKKKEGLAFYNLKRVFGHEKTDEEIHAIVRSCFNNFGRGMIETIYFIDRSHEVEQKVRFVGKEHLDVALKKGNGVILVGAHFGNFLLMYFRLVAAGYPTNVIMKRTRDSTFEEYITEFISKLGIKTIYDLPARQCIVQSIRALRNNEVLFILLDQNYGGDGRIFVDFFGIQAATAAGPVVFSHRTGASILPVFMMREEEEKYKLVFEPPFAIEEEASEEATIQKNIESLTKIIERYVRTYPHEWGGWMHKRWKSRTSEEQAVIDALNKTNVKKVNNY